jgi:hypothetical protein
MCYCMCSGNSFFCCKISDFDTSLSILRRNKSIHGFWISAVQKKVFIFLLGKYIKVVQGVSHWNEQSNLALTGIKIDNFIDIMCSTNAWGYDILTFVTIFQKSNIGWPQQPPTERVSDISKKTGFLMIHSLKRDQYWSFWYQGWSDHQVQEVLWWNEAVEVIEATEVVEAVEVIEAAEVLRPGKSLLRISESSRF